MKLDLTKIILTVVAVLLAVCAVRLPLPAVRADNPEPILQFDPEIRQIDVPGGSASLSGRVAIDSQTGFVYGFPTGGVAYPRNLQNNDLAVSRPILLGRFEIRNLPRK
ncbi:MAG: hypothetical protein LAP40_22685 [Acidobacteriia bacterium]|nr:hypothetical protein [Terriglobia bacterium]